MTSSRGLSLALPDTSTVRMHDSPVSIPGGFFSGQVFFPKDGVVARTVSMEMVAGKPESRKRLETQILHYDGEDWRGYTYAWRDDESDADLVPPEGAEKVFKVSAGGKVEKSVWSPTGKREQVWTFHSRAQCISCHNAWSKYAMAFSIQQLNRTPLFGGVNAPNQLVRLTSEGYCKRIAADNKVLPAYDAESVKKEPALTPLNSDEGITMDPTLFVLRYVDSKNLSL